MCKNITKGYRPQIFKKSQKLLSAPKKVNFGPGSGDADLGFHKRALGSNFAGFDAPMQ